MGKLRSASMCVRVIVPFLAALIMAGCAGTPRAAEGYSGPTLVYWTLSNNGPDPEKIVFRANGDGSNRQAIVSPPHTFHGWFLALDPASGQVLWTTVSTIARTNLNGTADVVQRSKYNTPMGIAVDSKRGLVYWADSGLGSISVSQFDGSNSRVVLSDLYKPYGLALDATNNVLYWTARGRSIFRSSVAEPKLEVFAESQESPGGIAVDSLNGRLYWTDTGSIVAANTDGTDVKPLIVGLVKPIGVAVDPVEGKIYWTDGGSNKVQRANVDGTGVETIADTSPYYPFGIAVLLGR